MGIPRRCRRGHFPARSGNCLIQFRTELWITRTAFRNDLGYLTCTWLGGKTPLPLPTTPLVPLPLVEETQNKDKELGVELRRRTKTKNCGLRAPCWSSCRAACFFYSTSGALDIDSRVAELQVQGERQGQGEHKGG